MSSSSSDGGSGGASAVHLILVIVIMVVILMAFSGNRGVQTDPVKKSPISPSVPHSVVPVKSNTSYSSTPKTSTTQTSIPEPSFTSPTFDGARNRAHIDQTSRAVAPRVNENDQVSRGIAPRVYEKPTTSVSSNKPNTTAVRTDVFKDSASSNPVDADSDDGDAKEDNFGSVRPSKFATKNISLQTLNEHYGSKISARLTTIRNSRSRVIEHLRSFVNKPGARTFDDRYSANSKSNSEVFAIDPDIMINVFEVLAAS
ncbi:hypothetical protein KPH14_013091, partial [Odynerus spinipes]